MASDLSKNWYCSNTAMIDSGTFWRCPHGRTKFVDGCEKCKVEYEAVYGFDDTARLDFLLEHHANVETDGAGHWRVVLEWTNPETYFPYGTSRRDAIDTALKQERIRLAQEQSKESK